MPIREYDGEVRYSMSISGPSIRMTEERFPALQAELQAAYDARGGTPGNFETFLVNTATFEGTDRTAQVRLRGSISPRTERIG